MGRAVERANCNTKEKKGVRPLRTNNSCRLQRVLFQFHEFHGQCLNLPGTIHWHKPPIFGDDLGMVTIVRFTTLPNFIDYYLLLGMMTIVVDPT